MIGWGFLALLPVFWGAMMQSSLRADRLIGALRALAFSLRRGAPLVETLVALGRESWGTVQKRCFRAADLAAEGAPAGEALSGLFAMLPADLTPVPGSGGEDLAQALEEAAQRLEERLEGGRRWALDLLYPALLGGVLCVLGSGIGHFVLPQFLEMFEEMGVEGGPSQGYFSLLQVAIVLVAILAVGSFLWVSVLSIRLSRDPWAGLALAASDGIRRRDLEGSLRWLAERSPWRRLKTVAGSCRKALQDGASLPDALARAGAPDLLVWQASLGTRSGDPARALAEGSRMLEDLSWRRGTLLRASLPVLFLLAEAVLAGGLVRGIFGWLTGMAGEILLW